MEPNADFFLPLLKYSIVIGTFLVVVFYSVSIAYWAWRENSWFIKILQEQFAATIGLPLAAIGSLVIVILLEFTSGPIKLEAWGIKFEGAAAPALMWTFCFLAMASVLKMLWRP